ncbi:unnamed protein product, partial [Iphiclides podalirius]
MTVAWALRSAEKGIWAAIPTTVRGGRRSSVGRRVSAILQSALWGGGRRAPLSVTPRRFVYAHLGHIDDSWVLTIHEAQRSMVMRRDTIEACVESRTLFRETRSNYICTVDAIGTIANWF